MRRLGNKIEKVTKFLGVPTCSSCQKRRDWLNSLDHLVIKKEEELPEGHQLVCRTGDILMTSHIQGLTTWKMKDGHLSESHSFCVDCGLDIQSLAFEDFQRRCGTNS